MKLIPNWRAVLAQAWSVRLAVLSAIVSAASTYWFVFAEAISPVPFFVIGIGLSVLTVLSRIVDQGISK